MRCAEWARQLAVGTARDETQIWNVRKSELEVASVPVAAAKLLMYGAQSRPRQLPGRRYCAQGDADLRRPEFRVASNFELRGILRPEILLSCGSFLEPPATEAQIWDVQKVRAVSAILSRRCQVGL